MSTQKLLSSYGLQEYVEKHNIPSKIETLELKTKTVYNSAGAIS